jgi:hypothetical protein
MNRKPDHDTLRGTGAALRLAFAESPAGDVHLGARAAEADFAALRAQLNDPPPQYAGKAHP